MPSKVNKNKEIKSNSDVYEVYLGTFIDNAFTWYSVAKYKDLTTAYKEFKKYVNTQLKYTDEELQKVWDTGRLDIELRQGSKLLNWVGIYSRKVVGLTTKEEKEVEKGKIKKKDKPKKKDSVPFKLSIVSTMIDAFKKYFATGDEITGEVIEEHSMGDEYSIKAEVYPEDFEGSYRYAECKITYDVPEITDGEKHSIGMALQSMAKRVFGGAFIYVNYSTNEFYVMLKDGRPDTARYTVEDSWNAKAENHPVHVIYNEAIKTIKEYFNTDEEWITGEVVMNHVEVADYVADIIIQPEYHHESYNWAQMIIQYKNISGAERVIARNLYKYINENYGEPELFYEEDELEFIFPDKRRTDYESLN